MSHSTRRGFLATSGLTLGACLLCRGAHASAQDWTDERTYGPFDCKATFSLGELHEFFQELSRLEQELRRTLAAPAARETIDVFLLGDERSHRSFLAELYPRVPYRRALYVQRGGRGAVYAYRHDELPIDLRHECTHALLHASLAPLPLWLDEGLAEYFEMPEGKRAFDHPHLATLRWSSRLGMVRSVESLESRHELSQMGVEEYQFAWAWVHFMLHGPLAAHRTLVEYLGDIRRGDEAGRLSPRLRAAAPDVDERVIKHFQHWQRG